MPVPPSAKTIIWPAGGPDDAVCQYRLQLPCEALRDQGADVVIDRRGPVIVWNREWHGPVPPPDARAMALSPKDLPQCDTIVMQRPAMRWWADVIPMLQKEGIRVVVDVDDDFNAIDKTHASLDSYDPKQHGWHNREWISEACKRADLVTCTTPTLLATYGFGHGLVIPNYVPSRYLKIEPHFKREKTAGWTGKISTHPKDLKATHGGVGQALAEHGWHFHMLGKPDGIAIALRLQEEPTTTGWVPFAEYPMRMAEVELGIVPLDDSRFNRAKSALKVMEYAALGVPVVASSTPDNLRMAELGVGLTVKRPHQWRKVMNTVLANDEMRAELAGNGRERMAEFTYEKQAWRWDFAWKLDGERINNMAAVNS